MPKIPKEDTPRMKRRPMLMSLMKKFPANGMTEKTAKAAVTLIAGASKKTNLSAPAGIMSSLRRSLMPSATGWSRPQGPTRMGPSLACMKERTLRST